MSSYKVYELENLRKFIKDSFLIYRINELEEQIFSYEELLKFIELLHKQLIIRKIKSPSSFAVDINVLTFDAIALLVGILNYGCYFCPVPRDASESFLNNCAPGYVLSDYASITEKFQSIEFIDEIIIFKEKFRLYVITETKKNEVPRAMPVDMCYMISTTGTTGIPKMVHVPYKCIEPNISALCHKFQLNKDVIYLGTPFTFDPFVVELFMALATGATLLLTLSQNRLNTKKLQKILWPADCSRSAVTVLQMTPTNFRQFGLADIKEKIFGPESKLRILILGGEDFPRRHELIRWLPQKLETNVRIFNIYGITELSCWSTIYEWHYDVEYERAPLGLPLDDSTCLRIVSTEDDGEVRDCGEGELLVGSAKRKTFIPQIDNIESKNYNTDILYRSTGDLVERSKTGDIFYIGRLNDIVKRGGKRICLTAIEQKLEHLLSTFGYVQIVFLWHVNGQQLICCIKIDKEFIEEIKGIILKNLTDYEKPDRIVTVEEFPFNKHNKLDRKKLLEDVLEYSCPPEPIEKFQHFLNEILQFKTSSESTTESTHKRLKLELECDKMSKSFTAAGGSSFQALSLATEIGEALSNSNDQRKLLKMLVDANTSILEISNFLKSVAVKEDVFETRKLTRSSSETVHRPKMTERKLKILWRVYMEKCIDATPALRENFNSVCIGSHAGLLLCVKASTGEVLSRFRLRERIECQVAYVSSELALVGCNGGYLYGLNLLEGLIKWTLYIGNKIKAKPLVIDTTYAIVGCYNNEFNLVGVCLQKQQIKWRKKIGTRPIFAAPILLDSCKALICALDGTYECLDVQTSQTIWTQKCDSPIFSTPKSINNGKIFLAAEVEGKLHMCQSETGQILQTFQCDGNIFSNIQTFQDGASILHVIFGCHDHHVYCLKFKENESENPETEMTLILKWNTKLNAAVFATPNVIKINDTIYVIACSTKGLLAVLENSIGIIVDEYDMENEVFSSICCVQNSKHEFKIYFGCRDNYFYCFQY